MSFFKLSPLRRAANHIFHDQYSSSSSTFFRPRNPYPTATHKSTTIFNKPSTIWDENIKEEVYNGNHTEALRTYEEMSAMNIRPTTHSLPSLIKACGILQNHEKGIEIHETILRKDPSLLSDPSICNAFITFYSKFNSLDIARQVFDEMPTRVLVSWNSMIAGYAHNGMISEALGLIAQMIMDGMSPDSYTISTVLSRSDTAFQGVQMHALALKLGFCGDVHVGTALLHLYARFGNMVSAELLFRAMPFKNLVSWNAMVSGFNRNQSYSKALICLAKMAVKSDDRFDSATFSSALSACAHLKDLRHGTEIHGIMVRTGFAFDSFSGSALADVYAKCGRLDCSSSVFARIGNKTLVSWNALIAGYSRIEKYQKCFGVFVQMQRETSGRFDIATVITLLPVCAHLSALLVGMQLHCYAIKTGVQSERFVSCGLIHMYSKCKMMELAERAFEEADESDCVNWSALIAGKVQNGKAEDAIEIFALMQAEDIEHTPMSISSVLPACAELTALRMGRSIHCYALKCNFESDFYVGSALVDMYSKCGNIESAYLTFENLPLKNVVTWNTMITGYGVHGHGQEAVRLFEDMQKARVKPTHVTFVGLLSACSHSGLVDEGLNYFKSMRNLYGLNPTVEHYTCLVDLLGRAGRLDHAYNFIKSAPKSADPALWGALLGACKIHGNIELGLTAIQYIVELQPKEPGYYVLMANMFSLAGRWSEANKMRALVKDNWMSKTPGCSWIETQNKLHVFVADSTIHPQSKKIKALLQRLCGDMKESGYVPTVNLALQDVEEEDKECSLSCHSERLAIAFGILNELPQSPIRVTKNLRVCGDCHIVSKFISKITRRKIILRDAIRFHHFEDGVCSCHDYW